MARKNSMIPMPTGGRSVVPKIVGALVFVSLLAIVVKHPADAATWMKALFAWLGGVVDGLVTFAQHLGN